jgi:anti-sigma-K factor RskA
MTDGDHTLAAAYALDALDDDERAIFEQHLIGCEACADDVREMTATTARFALAETLVPPATLRPHVLELARQTTQATPESRFVPLRPTAARNPVNRWLAGVAAAAVLVAGALGVTAYQGSQRASELQATASQLETILSDPNTERVTTSVVGGGTGTFILSRESQQGVLVTAGIPSVSNDETYQLWAINDAGAQSIGLYDASSSGDGTAVVDFPDSATTFGMTVEPSGGSTQPTTDPVLVVPLGA